MLSAVFSFVFAGTHAEALNVPSGTDKSFVMNVGQTQTVAKVDWGFTDTLDNPSNQFVAVKITSLPSNGVLQVDGLNATNGHVISMLPGPVGLTWTARESTQSWQSVASSSDGAKWVAAVYNGQIYTSMDSGVNWTARESTRQWFSVASSADGTKLVASVLYGQLYTSTDSGINWTARESNRAWRSVASSADGTKLVAAADGGQLYTSSDSGTNWTARESIRSWTAVASSADGLKLVAAEIIGQLYTSTNAGMSWTARESDRIWSSVASSADGTKLVAAVDGGQIYTSTDSGTNWTARESTRNWTAVASSSDGSQLAAAANGGHLYMSMDSGVTWTSRENIRAWSSVATSADGSTCVAAMYDGQLYTSVGVLPVVTYIAGSGTNSLTFQVQDDGATNNLDLTPNTLTFHVSAPGGFAQWASDNGLVGDAAALFVQDSNSDGVANGFEYAFGTNIPSTKLLLTLRRTANGRMVAEIPAQEGVTVPYVVVRVLGSTNLTSWTVPVEPASDTTGKPSNRTWYQSDDPSEAKIFFKLEAELQ